MSDASKDVLESIIREAEQLSDYDPNVVIGSMVELARQGLRDLEKGEG